MMERQAYAENLKRLFRQVVGAMLSTWQRTLRLGLITGASTLLVAEVVSCVVTSSFPPPAMAHLVALALALAVGYGAAITLLMGILLTGGVTLIRQLEGEEEIGAHTTGTSARRSPNSGGSASIAQRDTRRDPDDALTRAPTPVPTSRPPKPVPVSHLPRIAWAYVEQGHAPPPALRERRQQDSVPLPPTSSREPPVRPATAHDVPESAPGDWRRPGRVTRPRPAETRPLSGSGGTRSERLWERVSQALVGQPASLAPQENGSAASDGTSSNPG